MADKFISLPDGEMDVFVHIPHGLDRPYLESVISRHLGKDVAVLGCRAVNLCADKWGKVSCSGATVLRLSLDLSDGTSFDMVAKILSPDPVNLFKIDCRFDARLTELTWATWWGEQNVPFVTTIYDTRCDLPSREFVILQEHFPAVGCTKDFSCDEDGLGRVFGHAADLHAHSRNRIGELERLFNGRIHSGHRWEIPDLLASLDAFYRDTEFCGRIGVSDDERRRLEGYCEAVRLRPAWVDSWDIVCVTLDLAPDNFGLRRRGTGEEYATFDWGTTRLGPMELDIRVLLERMSTVSAAAKADLLAYYLESYTRQTGHRIDQAAFEARIPWAWFLFHLRMIAEHAVSLRWVAHQTRSREFIHLFIGACEGMLNDCRRTA